jgi:excinuclease ABC subunit B
MKFQLESKFKPTGDQPAAIKQITENLKNDVKNQVLLGVTGSGKTFTMANVIQNVQKPTLIISHNKTLAGQLYQEFRDFFPNNAVSYFVSYYDYYQPEAYVPTTDTYIEKESEINEEIDKLRLAATANLLTRKDVIVVASVSCIYNIGSPVEYGKFVLELKRGVKVSQQDILLRLTDLQYDRNDYEFKRGAFRVRGNAIDLFPAYVDHGIRIEVTDVVTNMYEFDPLTGDILKPLDAAIIYPAKHYMTDPRSYHDAFARINADVDKQVKMFRDQNKLIEAQRIAQRTSYDLEMLREVGYVNGIENYSIYFDNRPPGSPPYSLIDYFQAASDDWLLLVDESHITIPQIGGMYNGDRARKQTLIDYGFRLPSALDNRPLKFDEFMRKTNQTVYVSATPNEYELSLAIADDPSPVKKKDWLETGDGKKDLMQILNEENKPPTIVEQLIRPTGLVDPVVVVKPSAGQIVDLMDEIKKRVENKQRVLVTTLTKRMSEELTSFLEEHGVKVAYLHSDIVTLERQDVLDSLRSGEHDVVVGINLLREGLDLPEVSLVAILDADKEGFLRSRTSLIQTMGRAARNVDAQVIMYADTMTKSMKAAIEEGERRRKIQLAYNKKHGIVPQTIIKDIRAKLVEQQEEEAKHTIESLMQFSKKDVLLPDEKADVMKQLRKEMKTAAERMDFETAIAIRDQISKVKGKVK